MLFQEIMRMPEYYPTRCEYDILEENKSELLRHFSHKGQFFRLIELGAGDGLKTEVLLKHFIAADADFTYIPVDVSASVLEELTVRLTGKLPQLSIHALNKLYDEALVSLRGEEGKKVILFMGANIGNFTIPEASQFLKKLSLNLSPDDMLLIGFDLKKHPRIIQEAYDDPRGLTEMFNLNILTRLNRDLGADFDTTGFCHYPYYDPETGATKSFIISMKQQTVHIDALETDFVFGQWEPIQTEVSQKYDLPMIEKMLALAGLSAVDIFYDNRNYFCDVLAKPAERK